MDAGVSAEQYDSAINNLVVRAMTATQIQAVEKFGVTGTPSFFVKGKYLIRNGGIESMTEEGYGSAFSEIVSALLQKKSA
ncbi:DsbA family protein [Salmonella enterica]